ncbi:hypothetical protein DFH08DRAFT_811568 [Mycena albidolilacea]|uniref:Uncharacterized protein n=1 Tax=Mycena albidolilacea TaxID=1033008 RepID=A0AAD7ENU6_9AGAR|nr:hypothetical protein DFH08DRAFT_811568 [Mycena albidolilacea]
MAVLSTSVAGIHSLRRFSFTQCFVRLGDVEPVFKALCQHCPNLRELDITCEDVGPDFNSVIGHVWELRNLTRVSITVTRDPGIKGRPRVYLAQTFEMLSVCPHLQNLRIASEMRGPAADMSDLLASRSWPDPRRLMIEGDFNILAPASARLEVLSLPKSLQLPERPNLCWLYALDFSTVIPADLPQLEYAVAWNAHWDGVMSVLCALPTLRGATLAYGELQQDRILSSPALRRVYRNVHVSGGPYLS